MTVYVDDARIRWMPDGRWRWGDLPPSQVRYRAWRMSHLFADTDEELHAFAAKLGLQRKWHQCPPKASWSHYDVTDKLRKRALELGAEPVKYRELPTKLKTMGRR
jgi:hypothetical protein